MAKKKASRETSPKLADFEPRRCPDIIVGVDQESVHAFAGGFNDPDRNCGPN